MVDKQPIIHNLQDKADEANKSSRWWDMVSFAGFAGWVGLDLTGKPSTARNIGSWVGVIVSLVAGMWASSWKSRANAFEESVNEVRNAPDSPAEATLVNWQQKVSAEPSQEVAPTIIRR